MDPRPPPHRRSRRQPATVAAPSPAAPAPRRHRDSLDRIHGTAAPRRHGDHRPDRPRPPDHRPPRSPPEPPRRPLVIRAIAAEQKVRQRAGSTARSQGKNKITPRRSWSTATVRAAATSSSRATSSRSSGSARRSTSTRPRKFWSTHATRPQTKEYGGKWIEFSAVDTRFESFDQFLDAADLVDAAFEGHTAPLTAGQADDLRRPQGRHRQGHGHEQRARGARA